MPELKNYITEHIETCSRLLKDEQYKFSVAKCIEILCCAIKNKHPILIFGNGGSASDAQHIAGELIGRFKYERSAYNVICLNSNTSVITALANDYSYDDIFSRQIEAHGGDNAVCFGITTSGKSKNVIRAFQTANRLGYKSIALVGPKSHTLPPVEITIKCPGNNTATIQEMHIISYHYICGQVEKLLQ